MIAAGLCDAAARWSQAHPGVTDQALENTKHLRPGIAVARRRAPDSNLGVGGSDPSERAN
jgi:hypothetical protein